MRRKSDRRLVHILHEEMNMRVFFSYSHDSEEHKAWVKSLAKSIESRGMEPILDQNDLNYGDDILQFAEAAVESSTYVLMVCTPNYAIKAKNRRGGVGWEINIITSELYRGTRGKFIVLLRDGSLETSIPGFMRNTLYVDMRGTEYWNTWNRLCDHMQAKGEPNQIGDIYFEALFEYDKRRIHDPPRLPELRRFTEFIETGQTAEGYWYVLRRDPIRNNLATILFRTPSADAQKTVEL